MINTEKNVILYEHALFKNLNIESIELLERKAEVINFKKNEFLYRENDLSDGIFILLDGTIVITVKRESRDVINRIVFKNDVFGIDDVLDNHIRSKGAKSVGGDVKVLFIDKSSMEEIIDLDPRFSQRLFKLLIKNLKRVEKRLESFVFKDAKDRIIDFIKVNASNTGVQIGYETLVKHSFTQQNIADYTGTSRQTVTTIFKELKKYNKINFQRKRILVRNLSSL